MASWTDEQLQDAAERFAGEKAAGGSSWSRIVEAFKAGVVWGEKQEQKQERAK